LFGRILQGADGLPLLRHEVEPDKAGRNECRPVNLAGAELADRPRDCALVLRQYRQACPEPEASFVDAEIAIVAGAQGFEDDIDDRADGDRRRPRPGVRSPTRGLGQLPRRPAWCEMARADMACVVPSTILSRSLMVRAAVLCLILFLCGSSSCAAAATFNSCPRPSDQRGPLYETVTGAFQSRGVSAGGGMFITIIENNSAGPISVNVVAGVFESTRNLPAGTRITLVGYVSNSLSGVHPPYSCLELAR
jgi:hypothetical protein